MTDVVATHEQGAALEREPLIVVEPLAAFLAQAGVGEGVTDVGPVGAGHSNVTFAFRCGSRRLVLRRPPRGPLPKSAHDVLREARLVLALGDAGVRVPEIVAVCEDPAVIGAPFYVMPFIDGHVLSTEMPAALSRPGDPGAIAAELVDCLAEIHAVDLARTGLSGFGRPDGYLERQVRRFRTLLEDNATRPLPELEQVADWLDANRPVSGSATVVHGDYRLGNMMFAADPTPRLVAALDWELATIGDPLADVGYMSAMWAHPGDAEDPMLELSAVTRTPGFPSREALVDRYERVCGRGVAHLAWYQTLAIWKSAIFLESSYRRHLAGTTDDPYFARLGPGVTALARRALRTIDTA